MDLIHTKLDSPMQDTHLIRQAFSVSPSSNQTLAPITYVGLGWFTTTDFNSNAIWHTGSIYGYTIFVGFNPEKKIGLAILCSCDDRDVPLTNVIEIGVPYLLKS